MLYQKDLNEKDHFITFKSKQLSFAERNYAIYERELLAIKEAL